MATDYKDIIVRFRAEVKELEKGLSTVEKELGNTSKEAEKQNTKWAASFEKVTKAGMALGAAGVGLSAGINALIERNKELEKTLGKTSITTGIASDELRKMAMDAYDATTPLEEVTSTLDALGRTGIKNAEDMKLASEAILDLADANDVAGDTLVRGISPALKAFNIDIQNSAAYSDILTYALNNTTYEFTEYSNVLEKTAPRAQEIDISFKGLNAVLLALSDRGVDGKNALTMITQAMDTAAASTDESKDKLTVFLETLELSPEEIAKYTTAMDGAAGITDKYAENSRKAAGFSGELKVAIDKLTLSAGDALSPFESINTGLGAVSGTIMTVAGSAYLASGAMTALGISCTGAVAGIAAVAAPIAAVAAALAAVVAMIAYGEEINDFLNKTFGVSAPEPTQDEFGKIAFGSGPTYVDEYGITQPNPYYEPPTTKTAPTSGGGCFIAGTPITMADGTKKPIEYIKAGDMVLSFDPAMGETHAGRVAETMRYNATMLHTLCFEDGTIVKCTGEHPFYVGTQEMTAPRVHEWFVRARDLCPGDIVVRATGNGRIRETITQECDCPVYNFNVMPWHTYIAAGCLVHNIKTAMAEGGIVTSPTVALIGEAGPEAVIPLKNGAVNTEAVNTGAREIVIHNNIYLDGDKVGENIVRRIMNDRAVRY